MSYGNCHTNQCLTCGRGGCCRSLPASAACCCLLHQRTLQCGTYSVDCPNGRRACSACVRSCGVCKAAAAWEKGTKTAAACRTAARDTSKQRRVAVSGTNCRNCRHASWCMGAAFAACCCWKLFSRDDRSVGRCSTSSAAARCLDCRRGTGICAVAPAHLCGVECCAHGLHLGQLRHELRVHGVAPARAGPRRAPGKGGKTPGSPQTTAVALLTPRRPPHTTQTLQIARKRRHVRWRSGSGGFAEQVMIWDVYASVQAVQGGLPCVLLMNNVLLQYVPLFLVTRCYRKSDGGLGGSGSVFVLCTSPRPIFKA